MNSLSDRNKPHKDHIFPKSLLQKGYKLNLINNIGNLQFLSSTENESKNNIKFEEWIKNLEPSFIEKSFIPKNKELWFIENYEKFIEKRRDLMFDKLKEEINTN